MFLFFAFLLFLIPNYSFSYENLNSLTEQLFQDLDLVKKIDKKINDKLPLFINYQSQGGYFTMPSARTYDSGILGLGFSSVPPYRIYSLGFQFFDYLETTGNYWIYNDQEIFKGLGFGDDAERSANVKLILLKPKDQIQYVPDIALGFNDFLGSCRFYSFYVVATKEFLPYNLEATLGWGTGRIKGFFGGAAWTPFRNQNHFLKNFSLGCEYDANNYLYHIHEHANGKIVNHRLNFGIQYDFNDLIRFSASSLRGEDYAGSVVFHYNMGNSKGFFPKIFNSQPYTAPIDREPIGLKRKREELAYELAFAFQEQGFDLYNLFLTPGKKDQLWMKVVNVRYREEEEVRERIQYLLGSLIPSNIEDVTVVIEAEGVAEHEYKFHSSELKKFSEGQIGMNELKVIAPLKEASSTPSIYESALLYQRRKPIWILTFRPWMSSFFGSTQGKFKYEIGVSLGPEGYLFDQIYYSICGSYTAFSSAKTIASQDSLNPSRIINVRTDSLLYNQSSSFHLTEAFLQKSINWGSGWFSRLAFGYFEPAYGGVGVETLYYPVDFDWALGFEISTLFKRNYYGLGFSNQVRLLTNEGYVWLPYTGFQYFFDFYYQYRPLSLDFKISAGQFLARDKGIRLEGGRTFQSGLRVGLWYTYTNANDVVNHQRYYDKGFSITLPLDMFMNQSSRNRINYSMSAWLRDCGARALTGRPLYPTLYWERYNYKPVLF